VIALLRSVVFALVFYIGSVPLVTAAALSALLSPRAVNRMSRLWAGWFVLTTNVILGIKLRIEGTVPQTGAIVALKHQAAYETILTLWLFDDPAVVLKAELLDIPVWGYAARRHGVIPVDRAGSASALRAMLRAAQAARTAGRPIVIFPEGTRARPGTMPPLRPGLAGLYRALKLPLVPVALDSAQCWPPGFIKHAGVVTLRFLPAIPPGRDRDAIEAEVHAAINTSV
jgi:1-acyl-sn-glycerol-3-phosphate acyltransferase